MSEQKLINSLIAGDEAAFKEFVLKYQNLVFRTCYAVLKNKEDAEDCAQEVFIKTYENISKFAGACKISTWLYRISLNRALSVKRKLKRIIMESFDLLDNIKISNYGTDVNPPFGDHEAVLLNAIERLPKKQKKIFLLNHIEELPPKEIALILEMNLNSVEVNISRAKKKVKEFILDSI